MIFPLIGWAQVESPSPPAPAPISELDPKAVYPLPWSWQHWWEANRDVYLHEVSQRNRPANVDQRRVAQLRGRTIAALQESSESESFEVRAAAALALGRIKQAETAETLFDLARHDPSEEVRDHALIALGLLDTPEASDFLVSQVRQRPNDRVPALVALGLMTQAHSSKNQQRLVAVGQIVEATAAAWSLSNHPGTRSFFKGQLSTTENPWIASSAILALALDNAIEATKPIAEFLLGSKRVLKLPVWRALSHRDRQRRAIFAKLDSRRRRSGAFKFQYEEEYLKKHRKWQLQSVNPRDPVPRSEAMHPDKILIGVETIYEARLRASAAIALGQLDSTAAVKALIRCLKQPDDRYSSLYKGFALISLGQAGSAEAHPMLLDGPLRKRRRKGSQRSNLRGYAAIALGLSARVPPAEEDEEPKLAHAGKACARLVVHLKDRREESMIRSACALGLGLSGQKENIEPLTGVSSLDRDDVLLVGHCLLARGMLGDETIVEPARQLLVAERDKGQALTSTILGHRAAILGLGLLATPQADALSAELCKQRYYANHDIAVALSLSRNYEMTDALFDMLISGETPHVQVFAVQCLGNLYEHERPSRLGQLINGQNYTLKNETLVPLQSMANGFLFEYLIPATGDWL